MVREFCLGKGCFKCCHYPKCLYSTIEVPYLNLLGIVRRNDDFLRKNLPNGKVGRSVTDDFQHLKALKTWGCTGMYWDINLRIKLGRKKKQTAIWWCNMDQHGDNLLGFPNRLWLVMLISRIWDSHQPTPSQFPDFFHHQPIPSIWGQPLSIFFNLEYPI